MKIITAHRLGIPGVRTVEVRPQGDYRTLRVTRDNRAGFHVIEIHLTNDEAKELAQQLTRSDQ